VLRSDACADVTMTNGRRGVVGATRDLLMEPEQVRILPPSTLRRF
jgi:hypothetical protein